MSKISSKTLLFGLVAAGLLSAAARAECVDGAWEGPWFGPSPVPPSCAEEPAPPVSDAAPGELCFPAGCRPVVYTPFRRFTLAESTLPDDYPVLGFSGPCLDAACPEVQTQAFQNLWWNARQANRARRYVTAD